MSNFSHVPLYKKIADEYRHKIESGKLKPNSMIPSQTQLATLHKASLATIQKALSILVEEGLIHRIKKKGSFGSDQAIHSSPMMSLDQIKRIYFVYNNVDIAVLSQDLHQSMFEAIYQQCVEYQVEFSMLNLRGNMELPNDESAGFIVWGMWEYQAHGLMKAVENWRGEGRRLVLLHHYFPHLDIPYVNCDNISGGYLATQHLLSLGHTRIGIILSGKSLFEVYAEFSLRLQGYRMALASHGVKYDLTLVNVHDDQRETELSGYIGMQTLMSQPDPPTAIFAASDFKALGVLEAATSMNLRVPDELSVIGYDGYRFGQFTSPGLTTVDQNFSMLGKQAVNLILNDTERLVSETLVSPTLVIRHSTRELCETRSANA